MADLRKYYKLTKRINELSRDKTPKIIVALFDVPSNNLVTVLTEGTEEVMTKEEFKLQDEAQKEDSSLSGEKNTVINVGFKK